MKRTMRQLAAWVASACVGFVRACVVVVVSMLVPAVWAGAVALGVWWGASPWSWAVPLVGACLATAALSRPVCRVIRSLVEKWTTTVLPAEHREAGTVSRVSTVYWWNGFSYSRTSRYAREERRWRDRWSALTSWHELRFTAIAPITIGAIACVPPAGIALAAFGLGKTAFSPVVAGALGLLMAIASAPYAWRPIEPVAVRFLCPPVAVVPAQRVYELRPSGRTSRAPAPPGAAESSESRRPAWTSSDPRWRAPRD